MEAVPNQEEVANLGAVDLLGVGASLGVAASLEEAGPMQAAEDSLPLPKEEVAAMEANPMEEAGSPVASAQAEENFQVEGSQGHQAAAMHPSHLHLFDRCLGLGLCHDHDPDPFSPTSPCP